MTATEMREAIADARRTFDIADSYADDFAKNLQGRLHRVNPYLLKKLKRELQGFNMRTGEWKP